jgi:hypothetical protein
MEFQMQEVDMPEKRKATTQPASESSEQSNTAQNLKPGGSLRSHIKALFRPLFRQYKNSDISVEKLTELCVRILEEENIVLSRPERYRLFDQLWMELAQEISNILVIFSLEEQLTPRILSLEISPYLIAMEDIQHIIDEVEGRQYQEVSIKSITRNSPISISLDGVSQAASLIRDSIIPWRRAHDETMARLLEQEKLAEIESKKAEILEKRALSAKEREEARKLQLENERLRLQLQKEKIELAINLLQQLAPNLSEVEKTAYLVRLISPLETIIVNQSEVSFGNTAG